MPRRNTLIDRITSNLTILSNDILLRGTINHNDVSVSMEMTFCGLLNLIMGWDLENMNGEQKNYPGIDLGDTMRKIAVQVTADRSSDKAKGTLKTFFEYGQDAFFDELIIMVIKGQVTSTKRFSVTVGKGEQQRQIEVELDKPNQPVKLKLWDLPYLLDRITQLQDVNQIQKISNYLDKELGYLTPIRKKHELPGLPPASGFFLPGSRDRELAELEKMLWQDMPVFLWGLGGIGKTEVAIQLAKRCAPPEGAYFLRYYDAPDGVDALRETILRADFSNYRYQGADTEDHANEYKERLDILRTEYSGAILVIDNFDRSGRTLAELQSEQAYLDLTQTELQLVFTTRNQVPVGGLEIKAMDDGDLLKLMRMIYPDSTVPDKTLMALIQEVEGHTLMVALMAKTLRASVRTVSPEAMLEAFRQNGLKENDFPEINKRHNGLSAQGRIDQHLRTLFDMSAMKLPEKAVLRYATLLPEDGMDARLFKECLCKEPCEQQKGMLNGILGKLFAKKQEEPMTEQQAFLRMVETGWLTVGKENQLLIHPVIRAVCRSELAPTDDNCAAFLDNLDRLFGSDSRYHAEEFLQLAKCFAMASEKLEDRSGDYAMRAGWFWKKVGQIQLALCYQLRGVDRCKSVLPLDYRNLARAYNNVGSTCCVLKDYKRAVEYQQKTLIIYEQILRSGPADLVTIYNNMGTNYEALDDNDKAMEYYQKAMDICAGYLSSESPVWVTVCCNVGMIYGKMGNHAQALEHHMMALESMNVEARRDNPNTAIVLLAVGHAYDAMNEHQQALQYYLEALDLQQRTLPKEHFDFARTFNHLSHAYSELGDYQKALEYDLKGLEIQKKVFPPEYPGFATTYNNIGIGYANLENYSLALENLEKALAINESVLPPDHPNIISTSESIKNIRTKLACGSDS